MRRFEFIKDTFENKNGILPDGDAITHFEWWKDQLGHIHYLEERNSDPKGSGLHYMVDEANKLACCKMYDNSTEWSWTDWAEVDY